MSDTPDVQAAWNALEVAFDNRAGAPSDKAYLDDAIHATRIVYDSAVIRAQLLSEVSGDGVEAAVDTILRKYGWSVHQLKDGAEDKPHITPDFGLNPYIAKGMLCHATLDIISLLVAPYQREIETLKALVEDAFREGFNYGVGAGHDLSSKRERDADYQWITSDACAALRGPTPEE